jgi:hypothetical protein
MVEGHRIIRKPFLKKSILLGMKERYYTIFEFGQKEQSIFCMLLKLPFITAKRRSIYTGMNL